MRNVSTSVSMKLRECPFCGGEASKTHIPYIGGGGYGNVIECDTCWAKTGYYDTEAEAIEAWNTRYPAEIDAVPVTEENMKQHGWVRERTCKNVMEPGYNYFECSECGEKKYSGDTRFNYCPNCRAKVVE